MQFATPHSHMHELRPTCKSYPLLGEVSESRNDQDLARHNSNIRAKHKQSSSNTSAITSYINS